MRGPIARRTALLLVCTCALAGAYLCAGGLLRLNEVFFHPGSPSRALGGASRDRDRDRHEQLPPPPPVYDRLVVVLIDALRADMVLGSSAIRPQSTVLDASAESVEWRSKDELNAHMPYTRSLVASGDALAFVGHASVPTVTMPRLKALLTGRAPAFIDILKNFNSAALADDENLVALLRASGKRLVFYGDDTWLKLFPSAFARADGTSGFFTRDTVEVDANVTRHLARELDPSMEHGQSRDWDVLLLHYLGLDHVGHLRGPRSPLMAHKLSEMDAIVERIHRAVKAQDERRRRADSAARASLVLVCSDHGMSEVGNHGGATLEESSALLMFLSGDGRVLRADARVGSPRELRRRQVDLVPTIAALFGLRIPALSTGVVLQQVVHAAAHERPSVYDRALYSNVQQLRRLGEIRLPASTLSAFDARYLAAIRRLRDRIDRASERDGGQTAGDSPTGDGDVAATVLKACEELQEMLARSDGSEYDLGMFGAGFALLAAASTAALVLGWHACRADVQGGVSSRPVVDECSKRRSRLPLAVLMCGSALQIASLSSSSSIENEHATAFFLLTTLLLAWLLELLRRRARRGSPGVEAIQLLLLLVVTRALRTRNQVINFGRLNGLSVDATAPGNEFADDDSLSILSTAPAVPFAIVSPPWWIVWIAVAVSLKAVVVYHSVSADKATASAIAVGTALFLAGMAAVAGAKATSDDQAHGESARATQLMDADGFARVVYGVSALLVGLSALSAVGRRWRSAPRILADMALWLLVSLVQRASHLPTLFLLSAFLLVATWWVVTSSRPKESDGGTCISIAGLGAWFAQAAFFSLGNSHLVTTVDISQSYLGLSDYSQALVGLLTFLSAFSGPLVALSSVGQWIRVALDPGSDFDLDPSRQSASSEVAALAMVAGQTTRFMVYALVVFLMRFHLFIWSVFAPKMLYEVAQLIVSLVAALTVDGLA